MKYVSSDTSVWIDFSIIHRTELPFRLPYTFIMNRDAVEDELLSPDELKQELLTHGLISVEITIEEFILAEEYGILYQRLSRYDRIALAIAKIRKIILLTGDGALRKAAAKEDVNVIGTIGILDQLLAEKWISNEEFEECISELEKYNGREVRLPRNELSQRLQKRHK